MSNKLIKPKTPITKQVKREPSGSPHDRFFQVIYSSSQTALDIFKIVFPESAFRKCNWRKLKAEKETFKDRQADLVFSVPLKDKPQSKIKIFILIEHKSHYSKSLFKQILDYQNAIYQGDKSGDIISVVPIVFYHGKTSWSWRTSFKEGYAGKHFSDIPVFFLRHMLNYKLILFDTNNPKIRRFFKDERIKSRGALNALSRIWSLKKEVSEILELLSLFLSGFTEKEKKDLTVGLWDYLHKAKGVSLDLLKKVEEKAVRLRLLKKGGYMNFTDEIKKEARREAWQEAWQKAHQEGLREGRQEVILKMLQKKMDISFIAEVTGFPEKEIEKLKKSS